jgi:hypothetical protein
MPICHVNTTGSSHFLLPCYITEHVDWRASSNSGIDTTWANARYQLVPTTAIQLQKCTSYCLRQVLRIRPSAIIDFVRLRRRSLISFGELVPAFYKTMLYVFVHLLNQRFNLKSSKYLCFWDLEFCIGYCFKKENVPTVQIIKQAITQLQ